MIMNNKPINIVWCDDNIDALYNKKESRQELFANNNCNLYKQAKTAKELEQILKKDRLFIDAVIIDFNLGKEDEIPANNSADGFRWIHEHLENFAPCPFYLFSGCDKEFIENKYKAYDLNIDNDYFFKPNENIENKRNRYYQIDEFEELLSNIREEVSNIKTPTQKIRQEFSKAFDIIYKHKLDGLYFLEILSANEDIDRYEIKKGVNPLRKVVERMISNLKTDNIILQDGSLNNAPWFFSKTLIEYKDSNGDAVYNKEDLMHQSLSDAFKFFLEYTQDGSHDKQDLQKKFIEYLTESGDIYIMKALAIIGLDIIKWLGDFYDKYKDSEPAKSILRERITATITKVDNKFVIAKEEDNKEETYYIQKNLNYKDKYKEGRKILILNRSRNTNEDLPEKWFVKYDGAGEPYDK